MLRLKQIGPNPTGYLESTPWWGRTEAWVSAHFTPLIFWLFYIFVAFGVGSVNDHCIFASG